MAEPLDSIVAAVLGRNFEVSGHIWENFLFQPDRPHPNSVVHAIGNDDPTVLRHDHSNPRGSTCWIKGFDVDGRELFVSVGYDDRPVILITAYYTAPAGLEDGGEANGEEDTEEANSDL